MLYRLFCLIVLVVFCMSASVAFAGSNAECPAGQILVEFADGGKQCKDPGTRQDTVHVPAPCVDEDDDGDCD